MPRPSGDTEKRLLEAGRKQLYKTGITGLRLRQVAQEAGVNLGMFHYHFGSRDEFVTRLLKDIYKDFITRLRIDTAPNLPPEERLRRAITSMGLFVRENRVLIATLLADALSGDKSAAKFIRDNFTEHVGMLAGLLRECRESGAIADLPEPLLLSTIAGSLAAPAMMVTGLEKTGAKSALGLSMPQVNEALLSNRTIKLRVDMLMRAFRPAGGQQ